MKPTDITTESKVKLDECVVCGSCRGLFAPDEEDVHIRERGFGKDKEFYCKRDCPHCAERRPSIMPLVREAEDQNDAEATDVKPGRA